MLERLSVENYALIGKLDLELSPSLNIITGETGAGKSILLGAIGLILGNRADTGVLKDAGRNCVIEGVFDIKGCGLEGFFEDNGLDYDDKTVIRRVITPAGKSRAYVNDLPVQLTTLRELSVHLIDIHSQNQSELIADEGFRIKVLDSLAGNGVQTARYAEVYGELRAKETELAAVRAEVEKNRKDEEYLRYRWEQLAALGLKEGELAALEAEQKELANAEDILAALSTVEDGLAAEETGVVGVLKNAVQSLRHISGVLGQAAGLADRIESAYLELKDIEAEVDAQASRVESDPARLEAVDNRLGEIYALMKRNGAADDAELIAQEKELRARLESINDAGGNMEELEARIGVLRAEAVEAAAQVTASRRAAAERFDGMVEGVLGHLGMASARFVTGIEPAADLMPSGCDHVEFLFNANREVRLQPLEKVASGGETSRVMLALKSIVARSTQLPTIVFDEIDTGVSGRIADAMGGIIASLGEAMQVVNITHLPQVASKGDAHFLVYKEDSGAGVETRIRRLDADERVAEIAKMLSGSEVTAAAVSQARLLLGYGE